MIPSWTVYSFPGRLQKRVVIRDMMEVFEDMIFWKKSKSREAKSVAENGGHIIIDNTEALTAIDVNTGKYVGTTNLEDIVVNANLEAVEEIVRQIRLREYWRYYYH